MPFTGTLIRFSDDIDAAANSLLHAFAAVLERSAPDGVVDVIPAYGALYVEFRAAEVSRDVVRSWLARSARSLSSRPSSNGPVREVPTVYDGPDLAEVAAQTGMSVAAVVERHSAATYRVFCSGFAPGTPLSATVAPEIRVPRLDRPRPQVPVHSVAIANAQTTVYPLPTPGGWQLLGRTLERLYDPQRDPPVLLRPGDAFRFVPREGTPPTAPMHVETLVPEPRIPSLRVEEAGLLDLVVDRGRRFTGSPGFGRSGAADPLAAALANALLGNEVEASVLEMNGRGPVLTSLREQVVAVAGRGMTAHVDGTPVPEGVPLHVRRGARLHFTPTRHGVRAYLALAGGIEATPFLGSTSVDVNRAVGRSLRAGDVLGCLRLEARPRAIPHRGPSTDAGPTVLRVVRGPQATPERLLTLLTSTYRVASQNRVGVRLAGPPAEGGEVLTEPVPHGAVQVPADGQPIILLNDRGLVGGYAKPLVLTPQAIVRAGQLRFGEETRFALQAHHTIPYLDFEELLEVDVTLRPTHGRHAKEEP